MEAGLSWGLEEKPVLVQVQKRRLFGRSNKIQYMSKEDWRPAAFPVAAAAIWASSSAHSSFLFGVVGREVQELSLPLGYTSADLSFHTVMNQTLKVEQGQPNCCVQELLLMLLKHVMRLTYFSNWLLQWPQSNIV